MGNERPLWLGIVCWVLIITGTYGLYSMMKVLGTKAFLDSMDIFPYPAHAAIAIIFVTLVVMIVSGICMYERQGWARWFYIFMVPVYFSQRFFAMTAPPPLDNDAAQNEFYTPIYVQQANDHTREGMILSLLVILYLLSLWILFTNRARRYFHPPMYVDE